MSLARLRRWSRVVAVILLVAAGRGLPHFAQDDQECKPGGIQSSLEHDASDHALSEAARADDPNHCAICHWSRSLRSPLTSLSLWVADVRPPTPVIRRPAPSTVGVVIAALPARAPPTPL